MFFLFSYFSLYFNCHYIAKYSWIILAIYGIYESKNSDAVPFYINITIGISGLMYAFFTNSIFISFFSVIITLFEQIFLYTNFEREINKGEILLPIVISSWLNPFFSSIFLFIAAVLAVTINFFYLIFKITTQEDFLYNKYLIIIVAIIIYFCQILFSQYIYSFIGIMPLMS